MLPKPSFSLIKEKIREAKHILVVAHASADFDAASAVLALARMLEQSGKHVSVYVESIMSSSVKLLSGAERIKKKLPKEKADLVFGLDHGKMERLRIAPLMERDNPFLIAIDHHPPQDQQGDIVWVDSKKASTTMMIYELARKIRLPIDAETAHLLLFGLVSDTDGLTQENATPQALRVVAELVKRGASLAKVQAFISEWDSKEAVCAFAKIISRAEIDYRLRLLVAKVSRNDIKKWNVESGTISGFANSLRMIRGVEIALLLVEQKNHWQGHLRSRAESQADLGLIAHHFDGGGHFHAAGFKTALPARKIITKVKELLTKEDKR